MSLAQLLGHLKTGDLIIVRNGGNAALQLSSQTILRDVAGTQAGDMRKSRRLLRSLIAVRRGGAKKK
jgi:hypothetical protein